MFSLVSSETVISSLYNIGVWMPDSAVVSALEAPISPVRLICGALLNAQADIEARRCALREVLLQKPQLPSSPSLPVMLQYYATARHAEIKRRMDIKVRRYLSRPSLASVLSAEARELIARTIEGWAEVDRLRIKSLQPRFEIIGNATDEDFSRWELAYSTESIFSCMQAVEEFGVAIRRTWRCYLTPRYGLPDNGARLAVLWNEERSDIVARAIVVVPTADNGLREAYRVAGHSASVYGDDSLIDFLDEYPVQEEGYHEGFILAAPEQASREVLYPYLDGNKKNALLLWNDTACCHYWQVDDASSSLSYDLALCFGTHRVREVCECEHCGEEIAEEDLIRAPAYNSAATPPVGEEVLLCPDCAHDARENVIYGAPTRNDFGGYELEHVTVYLPEREREHALALETLYCWDGEFYAPSSMHPVSNLSCVTENWIAFAKHMDASWVSDDAQARDYALVPLVVPAIVLLREYCPQYFADAYELDVNDVKNNVPVVFCGVTRTALAYNDVCKSAHICLSHAYQLTLASVPADDLWDKYAHTSAAVFIREYLTTLEEAAQMYCLYDKPWIHELYGDAA